MRRENRVHSASKRAWLLGLAVLLCFLCPVEMEAQDVDPAMFPVLSYRPLDLGAIHALVGDSGKSEEGWAADPLRIALRIHPVADVKFLNIRQKRDRSECALHAVVTIVEEGFLDDQMRGRWTQYRFQRKGCKAIWKITEAREAFLCGMEGHQNVFLKELCPSESRSVSGEGRP
ncbi:hypothetical protein SAMN02746041_01311 [Desulfacinum hydrothermale DSM 13146]|uniref:Uncharacterized protein n=1 Tax=Desulfacinum hydrothermale DSM 13146 TaxID=1121390 RepID=A0A1W1XEJ9_9BACT|nr:hypothetical protein SAMN02746041_01311 [Desulfacinum hydrothermale DSM 13146]